MISAILSRLVILLFGTLYPAYASYKAVRTKNVKEYVKWMMYWIVFALFTCAETFTDLFLSFWFPFYYEIKIVIVVWLLSPATKGSSILYRNFVHPALTKREQEIDEYISKAKEQGYHTMLHLGSKGVTYATNVIMQTAIKGGGGIVNHLRRSYSLSDLSVDVDADLKADLNRNSKHQGDTVDTPDVPRDPRTRTQRKPGGSHVDLYFPEMDVDIRSHSHHPHELPVSLSQIRSSEDISSGYSSAEPLYGDSQVMPEGNPLMRTSSVGATRARGRGGRATTQSKKGLTTEEEDFTADYGWQHSLPINSLLPGLLQLDPSTLPPHAFLTPEALQLILTDSFHRNLDPYNICEIIEEDDGLNMNTENEKETESFDDAEQGNFMENDSIIEPNSISNHEEGKRTDEKNAFISESPLPSVGLNTENVIINPPKNIADDFDEKDKTDSLVEKSDTVTEPNKTADEVMEKINEVIIQNFKPIDSPSLVVNEVFQTELSQGNTDSPSVDVNEVFKTESSHGNTDSSSVVVNKVLGMEFSQGHTDSPSVVVNEVLETELSQGNTADKCFEEIEPSNECFEDASDGEVVLVIPIGEVFASPLEKLFDPNEILNQTGSKESLASSGDQCFEDSLLDVAVFAGGESPNVNDRKGKYNKGPAPLPPDIRKSEEVEVINTIPRQLTSEPDSLAGTTAPQESLQCESASDETPRAPDTINDYDVRDRESNNISPVRDRESISPSPSQTKKDNTNFSRFLPKTGMTSLFNFWSPKDDKFVSNKAGTNIHRTPSNKSARSENIPQTNDCGTSTGNSMENEIKTTPKLKIRQMSQSPSSRRRYNFD